MWINITHPLQTIWKLCTNPESINQSLTWLNSKWTFAGVIHTITNTLSNLVHYVLSTILTIVNYAHFVLFGMFTSNRISTNQLETSTIIRENVNENYASIQAQIDDLYKLLSGMNQLNVDVANDASVQLSKRIDSVEASLANVQSIIGNSKESTDAKFVDVNDVLVQYAHELNELKNVVNIMNMNVRNEHYHIGGGVEFNLTIIQEMIRQAIGKYDADKIGKPDFALQSAGASIVSIKCTEVQTKSKMLLGLFLYHTSDNPLMVINPEVTPGHCWAFKGFPGALVIQLATRVNITSFTLDHLPKSVSITGEISSAPRHFSVWGVQSEHDLDPVLLGRYEYIDNNVSTQSFDVQNKHAEPYYLIELRVESNHGHPDYTCLYRFRVHGTMVEDR